MNKIMKDNLCKGLRAIGISKRMCHQIMNQVLIWYDNSGAEWTNKRIKDLRQWYETCLTGNPAPPKWFKHSKEGYPLGIWKAVFDLPRAKALGVLSLNTVFYSKDLSHEQKEKFLHGLRGNGTYDEAKLDEIIKRCRIVSGRSNTDPIVKGVHFPKEMAPINLPTIFDMNGSIPVHDGRQTVRPNNTLSGALKALEESWASIPQVTFDFLDRMDYLFMMPLEVLGNEWQLELNRPHSSVVGRVSVLQQPQLKARTVGNPHRITQVTLEPLKQVYMDLASKLVNDVTHDQQAGVQWVQDKLRQGVTLAGSDLTSASDLLQIECCLKLVNAVYGMESIDGYHDYARYFLEVCRSEWYCPALNSNVKWEQGDVLGTGPSFGLLTLSNNAAATLAYLQAYSRGELPKGTHMSDSFRVLGDDIIMLEALEPYYSEVILALGGEINFSKTLKSDKVAEFAGRVITADSCYLKAIKYSEPSDNSFMSYMAQLGNQAKYLLKPKQRKVYDFYKYVPGVAVQGPWMPDSYGVAFEPRYLWYLEEVLPVLQREEPALDLIDYDMVMLKAYLCREEAGETSNKNLIDSFDDETYQVSQVTNSFKRGGDPRLVNGRVYLDVLLEHIEKGHIKPFSVWYNECQTISNEKFDVGHQLCGELEDESLDHDDPFDR